MGQFITKPCITVTVSEKSDHPLIKLGVPFAEIWAFHFVCVSLPFTLRYVTHMHLHTYFVISIGHLAILTLCITNQRREVEPLNVHCMQFNGFRKIFR